MINLYPKDFYKNAFFHSLINTFTSIYHAADLKKERVSVHYSDKHLAKFLQYYPLASIEPNPSTSNEAALIEPIIPNNYENSIKIKSALMDLKEKVFNFLPESKQDHILVIQRSHNRILTNLDEIVNICKREMLTIVSDFEQIPFQEQVRLIANSKIVIAAHGSALSHIAFSLKGTTFIEVRPKYFPPNIFNDLANLFDRDLFTIYSTLEPEMDLINFSKLSQLEIETIFYQDLNVRKRIRDLKFIKPQIEDIQNLINLLAQRMI